MDLRNVVNGSNLNLQCKPFVCVLRRVTEIAPCHSHNLVQTINFARAICFVRLCQRFGLRGDHVYFDLVSLHFQGAKLRMTKRTSLRTYRIQSTLLLRLWDSLKGRSAVMPYSN